MSSLRELFEAAGYSVSAEGDSWRVEIAAQPRWVELVRRYWLTGNVESDSEGFRVQLVDQQTDDELWLPADREHVAQLAPDLLAILRQLDERIERLEDVAARWDVPGGSKRLARRALDKADGLRVARRLLS